MSKTFWKKWLESLLGDEAPRSPRRARPGLEALEDRTVPSTLPVADRTVLADSARVAIEVPVAIDRADEAGVPNGSDAAMPNPDDGGGDEPPVPPYPLGEATDPTGAGADGLGGQGPLEKELVQESIEEKVKSGMPGYGTEVGYDSPCVEFFAEWGEEAGGEGGKQAGETFGAYVCPDVGTDDDTDDPYEDDPDDSDPYDDTGDDGSDDDGSDDDGSDDDDDPYDDDYPVPPEVLTPGAK